jgi:hypothetical protein
MFPSDGKQEWPLPMQSTVTYKEMHHNKNLEILRLPKFQYFTDEHKKMQTLITIQHSPFKVLQGESISLSFRRKKAQIILENQ